MKELIFLSVVYVRMQRLPFILQCPVAVVAAEKLDREGGLSIGMECAPCDPHFFVIPP